MTQLNSLSDYLPLLNKHIVCQKLLPKHLFKMSNFLYYKIYKDAVIAILFGGDHV